MITYHNCHGFKMICGFKTTMMKDMTVMTNFYWIVIISSKIKMAQNEKTESLKRPILNTTFKSQLL